MRALGGLARADGLARVAADALSLEGARRAVDGLARDVTRDLRLEAGLRRADGLADDVADMRRADDALRLEDFAEPLTASLAISASKALAGPLTPSLTTSPTCAQPDDALSLEGARRAADGLARDVAGLFGAPDEIGKSGLEALPTINKGDLLKGRRLLSVRTRHG